MAGRALARPLSAVVWELRTAWASGRRVAVTLERADMDRVEGHVSSVAATDASVTVSGIMVPLDRVLAVHVPSRLGDSTVGEGEQWRDRGRSFDRPGQAGLWDGVGVAEANGRDCR